MVTVGVDIGGFTSKVCVGWNGADSVELHVNRVSNRETPTVVSFDKRNRIYGEEADLRSTSLRSSSIYLLSYLDGLTRDEFLAFLDSRKYLFSVSVDESSPEPAFTVPFDEQEFTVLPAEVYAFFVNKLLETVRKQLGSEESSTNGSIQLSLSVPLYFTDGQKRSLVKSLAALGLGGIQLHKQTECLLNRWCESHLPDVYETFVSSRTDVPTMKLAFMDVGFCHCTFFVAEIGKKDGAFEQRIISEESSDAVGTYQMIEKLADHVRSTIRETKGEDIKVPSRQALYIFKACAKALKELSVVNEVKIDCERVLEDGDDFSMTVSREKFEDLCAPLKEQLNTIISRQMESVEAGSLLAIEALGGGSRVPFVKALATDIATEKQALQAVRMSMDSTSAIATGAVCLARSNAQPVLSSDDPDLQVTEDEMKEITTREERFSPIENEEFKKRAILNEIDQYIIKTKNDIRGPYSQQVNPEDVERLLEPLERLAQGAPYDRTTSEFCASQLSHCRSAISTNYPDYFKALEEAERARENEIKQSALEQVVGTVSEVNMDVNLPKATCLKRAAKNKEEGNALISGGNIEMAAQHYVKALQYCSKVSNADEEERKQLDSLKLASNLNLAMCYIKMDTQPSYKKAVNCCTQALEISSNNTKALYRRAFAYDKLNQLDDALKDATLGIEKFPDNAELKLLHECLEKKVKLQEQRLKKVYARMF